MFDNIVVGVNPVDSAVDALQRAQHLAEHFGSTLHMVTAFDPVAERGRGEPSGIVSPARAEAEKFLERYASSMTTEVRTHALPGKAADAILQVAGEVGADLIVVGNRGMKGVRRVLGSVPNEITHRADCSVLVVNTT
jgi:nucleotide-binding universal stress UspA family protein